MYTEREPYLATPGTDSCWKTWHNSTVQRLHHRQTRSRGAEGWKDASEDNKWMIVQCATISKTLNPQNIDKSVSDIRVRIRFPFESSFWISLSGCKLAILPDIQPANRMVIISAWHWQAEVATGSECRSRLRQDSAFLWEPESNIFQKPDMEILFKFDSSRSRLGHF